MHVAEPVDSTLPLFVYGTLRNDVEPNMAHLLEPVADLIGAASVRGRLLDLGSYPGLVSDPVATSLVRGQLWRLRDPLVTLPALDSYEGCGPGDALPHEYARRALRVETGSDRVTRAWGYEFLGSEAGLRVLPSGDYAHLD